MARQAIEHAEPAAKAATKGDGSQTGKLVLAIGLLAAAGAAFYFFTADAPRPGDQVQAEAVEMGSTAPNTPASAPSAAPVAAAPVPAPAPAGTPSTGRPALVTPPVEGSTTPSGPGSRKPGGKP